MARIRTIRPELWESEKLGRLPMLARLTFIGLIGLADDEGRGRGEPGFLFGRLHPYAPDVSRKELARALNSLGHAHLVVFYEVEGSWYFYLPGWSEHQKIEKKRQSLLPNPPSSDSGSLRLPFPDSSPTPPRQVAVGMEGNGVEGTGHGGAANRPPTATERTFEAFWSAYPPAKRKKKAEAFALWEKLNPSAVLVQIIMQALDFQKRSSDWAKDGGQYIPLPSSWLSGQRWEDEVQPQDPRPTTNVCKRCLTNSVPQGAGDLCTDEGCCWCSWCEKKTDEKGARLKLQKVRGDDPQRPTTEWLCNSCGLKWAAGKRPTHGGL